ncbi:UNVERIFIED_CONTAM: hypothetical protein K2H54_039682 [Gekko kuhli]
MAKGKGKDKGSKGGRTKKGGGRGSKPELKSLEKEAEVDRAKAAAALWEARLEVTEVSRREYREAARRLACNNEELEWQQRKVEKDAMEVISFLKKQDFEKEELLEKMKQQLNEVKQQAKEEGEKLAEQFTKQLEELEEKFHKKAKEIGLIQIELKMIQEFRKEKAHMEKELEDLEVAGDGGKTGKRGWTGDQSGREGVFTSPYNNNLVRLKENLDSTQKEHQETICMLERKFLEEKQRMEREAEKKIIMLAERAHHEALTKLDNAGRAVFAENVRLHEALSYHMKETEELQKSNQKLEENNAFLLQEKVLVMTFPKEEILKYLFKCISLVYL